MYSVVLDASKAFDKIVFSKLFELLISRNISYIYLRCLLFIYQKQQGKVRWCNILSNSFNISNGVCQGAILSPAFFSIYLDTLVVQLRRSGIGCQIQGYYYGILCYADDIILLCPSAKGLRKMLEYCEEYGDKFNLSFSVNEQNPEKSKCKLITFSRNGKEQNHDIVKLKGVPLPSTTIAKHLGHYLTSNCLSDHDTVIKKCQFISKSHNILQEFYYAHPDTKLKLILIYCCNLYSSPLWDLYGKESKKLFNQWNVFVRTAWEIKRETHRRFIEKISKKDHLKNFQLGP